MISNQQTLGWIIVSLIVSLFFLQSCSEPFKANSASNNSGPKEYPVYTVAIDSVTTHQSYPATIEGVQTVELRPRVSGYLEEIYVDEGATVKKGQTLFKINGDEFLQQVNVAKASVAVAEAKVNTAKMEVEKQRPLVEKGIVSDYNLTAAQFAQESAEAELQQAKANLDNAYTNLNYTNVKSPTNGIIGTIPYRIGSLVGSSNAEPLTIIADISEVRAYFAVNEKDFLELSKDVLKTKKPDKNPPKVNLVLADGSEYPYSGKIDAISGLINQSTGSATLRATFKNPDGLLRSGSSATIKIPSKLDSVIVVPQSSTFEVQNKRILYVVEEENKVTSRVIKVDPDDSGKLFIVKEGLQSGEKIVLDGINALKDDTEIIPVETEPDHLNSTR
ncbi:MAG: efflux RND transporter periplasmic adaptor subunit [Saprospiraceae bacterium]